MATPSPRKRPRSPTPPAASPGDAAGVAASMVLTTSPSGHVSIDLYAGLAPRRAGYLPYESEAAWQERHDPGGEHRRHYGLPLAHCMGCGTAVSPHAQFCGARGWECDASASDDDDDSANTAAE